MDAPVRWSGVMALVCTPGAVAAAPAILAPEPVGSSRTMYGLPAVGGGGVLVLWLRRRAGE